MDLLLTSNVFVRLVTFLSVCSLLLGKRWTLGVAEGFIYFGTRQGWIRRRLDVIPCVFRLFALLDGQQQAMMGDMYD